MSYAPKKVFVLENGKYVEITNEEHQHRKIQDTEYREKYFIPAHGCLMEVKYEEYKDFYQDHEHQKYIKKRDKNHGLISFGDLTELIIAAQKGDGQQKSETQEYHERMQKLKELIQLLDEKDQNVIYSIYFEGLTERQVASRMGISQPVLHRKKVRILKKLKNLAKLLYLDEEL